MSKFNKIVTVITVLTLALGSLALSGRVAAAELPPVSASVGSWVVANLAADRDGWKIESYKNDRDLVAWTEISEAEGLRRLYVHDGIDTRLLASMSLNEWNDEADAPFFDPVSGNYDVADGLVVWVKNDGSDREIYSFDGAQIQPVSNNTYDDKHPVTSRGRIAWTSVPGTSYNLMVKDGAGIHRLDGYHVLNYAWSGYNLFWMNRLPNEDWFRVFRYDGRYTAPVGEGDDRPLRQYFYVDGQGSAAWEYSTKRWEYDKRVIYLSMNGAEARRIIQRDVPPNLMRIDDVRGVEVLLNTTDLLTSLLDDSTLIRSNGFTSKNIARKPAMSRARFVEGGIVRHLVPETSSALIFNGDQGGEDYVSLDHVILDRFESDGNIAAGALLKGGIVTFVRGKDEIIPTSSQVRSLSVRGGDIAWIEGDAGRGILKTATQPLLVKTSAGTKYLNGHLVKTAGQPNVYLAAADGKRYLIPSEGQFFGWYGDFHSVRTLPAVTLSSLPLAGNVLYRPGYRLIKTADSPRVYAIGEQGLLHWVTSADTLVQFYGSDWYRTKLDTVPQYLLADYAFGTNIDDPFRFYMALSR